MKRTVALLIEDQPPLVDLVHLTLASAPDIELVDCVDPARAIELAVEHQPTVILQSFDPPNDTALLNSLRSDPATRDIPIILLATRDDPMISERIFTHGANDCVLKLPPRDELLARIRYHSHAYIHLSELVAARKRLADELDEGRQFVKKLLPRPIHEPFFSMDFRFRSCLELAGDMIGCDRLDPDHYAIYVLDVSHKGLQSAFHAVTVRCVIQAKTLPVDFTNPEQVLTALEEHFPMDANGGKHFTIWYGVFDQKTRTLMWSAGGHPSAIFVPADNALPIEWLPYDGAGVGMGAGFGFPGNRRTITTGDRLYVYSDGVTEVRRPGDKRGTQHQFVEFMEKELRSSETPILDRLLSKEWAWNCSDQLHDDFSIIEVRF
jgi:sigma-B regulation protein RsbU (phosphoserine phosphatase)